MVDKSIKKQYNNYRKRKERQLNMKTQKELKRELDNWYTEYCRTNKKAPTLAELLEKAEELGLDRI